MLEKREVFGVTGDDACSLMNVWETVVGSPNSVGARLL